MGSRDRLTGAGSVKKAKEATWSVELWVNCPYCREAVDLFETSEYLYGDPDLFGTPCESRQNLDIEVECPECKNPFIVDEVCY